MVRVSGGSWGLAEALGDGLREKLGGAVDGVVDITVVRGAGGPTGVLIDALSPLLIMTAVAMAPSATTTPPAAATGAQRGAPDQRKSP